jgi:ADP-heptose:LPS heptosyltransferase
LIFDFPKTNSIRNSIQQIYFFKKVQFYVGQNIRFFLPLLNLFGLRLTVHNAFPGIGDAMLVTSLIKSIKLKYPRIKINLLSLHEALFENISDIGSINKTTTFFSFRHWYIETRQEKNPNFHVLEESLNKLGLKHLRQDPSYQISEDEKYRAKELLKGLKKKLIAINTISKEPSKNWPSQYWQSLILKLSGKYDVVQLGAESEIDLQHTFRLAGKLNIRESVAVLEKCHLFIGPDSFLMHAAASIGLKSVIIFGGRVTPNNTGYYNNINLFERMDCGPCWIHEEDGEVCQNNLECLARIKVDTVLENINRVLK